MSEDWDDDGWDDDDYYYPDPDPVECPDCGYVEYWCELCGYHGHDCGDE